MFMMQGQCNARPTVAFSATERHHPLISTKLYCLVNRGTCVDNLLRFITWPWVEPACL